MLGLREASSRQILQKLGSLLGDVGDVQVATCLVYLGAGPADLTHPGHIFPLMAQSGGVLTRAGHTEAGCDFARSAGLEPAAVIVEILKDDGTMARLDEVEKKIEQRTATRMRLLEDKKE